MHTSKRECDTLNTFLTIFFTEENPHRLLACSLIHISYSLSYTYFLPNFLFIKEECEILNASNIAFYVEGNHHRFFGLFFAYDFLTIILTVIWLGKVIIL